MRQELHQQEQQILQLRARLAVRRPPPSIRDQGASLLATTSRQQLIDSLGSSTTPPLRAQERSAQRSRQPTRMLGRSLAMPLSSDDEDDAVPRPQQAPRTAVKGQVGSLLQLPSSHHENDVSTAKLVQDQLNALSARYRGLRDT